MNNGMENPVPEMSSADAPAPSPSPSPETTRKPKPDIIGFFKDWSWVLLLAASILIIGYYTLFPSRGYFHSDTTDTLMWAVASDESGSLFNPDFDYACLLPFSTSLIMWALIPVFGISMTTHVLGMLCFFLIFTGGMIWMLRKMNWSWKWISFGVFVELMICSGSEKLREIFWGHTIYYSLGVMFVFVGLGLLFQQMDTQVKCDHLTGALLQKYQIRLMIYTWLIGGWFMLACMNQIIAIAIFALPVMAAVFCERFLDDKTLLLSWKNGRVLMVFLVMGAGMVLGYLLTNVLSRGITAGYETTFSTYSGMVYWKDNFLTFPNAWLSLLGVEVKDGDMLMSAESVGQLLTVITGAVLLVVPVVALCCYRKIRDNKLRILILTFWFMTMLIMMGYIMGKLSNANWRLCPIVAMSAVVTVSFLKWAAGQTELRRIISLMMIPVVAVCTITAVTIVRMPPDNTEGSRYYAFAEELEEKNLHYGYATFWNANVVTVISDNAVKCRAVTIDENGCNPYHYQGCRSWYDDQPDQEQYFLLMTGAERNYLIDTGNPLSEKKVDEFYIEGYPVWVFHENIF